MSQNQKEALAAYLIANQEKFYRLAFSYCAERSGERTGTCGKHSGNGIYQDLVLSDLSERKSFLYEKIWTGSTLGTRTDAGNH